MLDLLRRIKKQLCHTVLFDLEKTVYNMKSSIFTPAPSL
jgi:hypothetical protein